VTVDEYPAFAHLGDTISGTEFFALRQGTIYKGTRNYIEDV